MVEPRLDVVAHHSPELVEILPTTAMPGLMQEISVESDFAKLAGVKFCNCGACGKSLSFSCELPLALPNILILLFPLRPLDLPPFHPALCTALAGRLLPLSATIAQIVG
jgi:hypothetical protein